MEPKPEPKKLHPLAQLAKDTVESYVKSGYMVTPRELTPEMKERAGVFVSIKKSGMLRGCIGTFEPRQSNVAEEIMNNAVSSATQDPRFPPVIPAELPHLTYSVDVLTKPEPVESAASLTRRGMGRSWRAEDGEACCSPTWRAWTPWKNRSTSAARRPASCPKSQSSSTGSRSRGTQPSD